jgi:methylated-DNA-[protein]-cysteine S-methyltransferase
MTTVALLRDRIATPIGGMILLAHDGALVLLEFEEASDRIARELNRRFKHYELIDHANAFGLSDKVRAYYAGDFSAIDDIETDGGGTPFQRRVWQALREIPLGETMSYGEVAEKLGDKNAMRAVGLANGRNPIAVVVPCHRVIGANGSMIGYGGGLSRKEWLLKHEGALLI